MWFSPSWCWGEAEGTTITWVVSPIPEGWSWYKTLVRLFIGRLRAWKVPMGWCLPLRGVCAQMSGPEMSSLNGMMWSWQGEPRLLWLFGEEDKLLSGHCPFHPTPPSKKPSDVRMERAPLLFARSGCMQERNARHQQAGEAFLAVWERTTHAFLCKPLYKVLFPS